MPRTRRRPQVRREPKRARAALGVLRCGAWYDKDRWHSLQLLERVDPREVEWLAGALPGRSWIELRRCSRCEQAVAAQGDACVVDDLIPTDAAARYCGF